MILHFEANIARRRHQICPQAFSPLLNRADLTCSVRLQLRHLLYSGILVSTPTHGVNQVDPVFSMYGRAGREVTSDES
jgi:hypothetical protein